MKKKYIKICPECGSLNISIPPKGLDFDMAFKDYCKKCRNKGNFPEVNIDDINKFRKKLKKN